MVFRVYWRYTIMKLLDSLKTYIIGVRDEGKRISWPSRKDATRDVIALLVFCVLTAVFLGAIDFGFLQAVKQFILR